MEKGEKGTDFIFGRPHPSTPVFPFSEIQGPTRLPHDRRPETGTPKLGGFTTTGQQSEGRRESTLGLS